jgi:hypothetical protein
MSYCSLTNTVEMDECHTQSSEKIARERVIVVLPIKLVLIIFNDFFLTIKFFILPRVQRPTNPTYYQTLTHVQCLAGPGPLVQLVPRTYASPRTDPPCLGGVTC